MPSRLSFQVPSVRNAASVMAIVLIVTSVLVAIFKPILVFVALVPQLTLTGVVWPLLTYAFVETTPMGVIFGAMITWSLGGALEAVWGRRRFILFSLTVVVAAAVLTVLVTLVAPEFMGVAVYPGGTVLTGSLWIAYGLHIGRGQTNFWGASVTGNGLAIIGAAFVGLNGAFNGLASIIPEAFALGLTFLYMRASAGGSLLGRFIMWRRNRDFQRRADHLRSIDGGKRNVSGDSDKYLH